MDTLELAHRERATENVDRGRFTDENFESILKAGGGSEHELDVLRLRLEEILERYIATAEKPTTEFEVSFLEFSHPPNMRKELTRVWKSCDKILAELAEVDVRYQLNSAREHGQSNAKFSVEYTIEGIKSLKDRAAAALKIETRGRKRDTALDTALLELADAYVEHFEHSEIWKVASSERSKFIRFIAEVLSHASERDFTEETLAKRWQTLCKEMKPLRARRAKVRKK